MSKVVFSLTEVQASALRLVYAGANYSGVSEETLQTLKKRGLIEEVSIPGDWVPTLPGMCCNDMLEALDALARSQGVSGG